MSKGNVLFDGRVDTATNCGTAKIGSRWSKTWSGADGRSRENAYTCNISYQNQPLIQWKLASSTGPMKSGSVTSCFGGIPFENLTSAHISASQSRALNGVLKNWAGHSFNAAVFLGELPESLQMITGSCVSVLRAYKHVRRGRFSKAVMELTGAHKRRGTNYRIDKSASSAWLSLRYGWIPLLSDSFEAVNAWNQLRQKRPTPTVKVKSRNKFALKPGQASFSLATAYKTYSTQTILRTDVKSNALNSLGFGNPLSLAWELLPLSFVVDWVYDIGSYLELAATLPTSSNTRYITTTFQKFYTRGPATKPGHIIHQSDAYVSWSIAVDRVVKNRPRIPLPEVKSPFSGDWRRVGDMLALATQLGKGLN